MDPLVALVATATAASVSAVVLGLVLRVRHRRAQARARAHEQRLAESAAEIERLNGRLDSLAEDVARAESASRATARSARAEEYVITTLADTLAAADEQNAPSRPARAVAATRPRVDLEAQLVGALARQRGGSAVRERAVDLVVQGVALAHGVRRALRPDVLDRAAAEAHVARRRSRRLRKAEIREARRLVRVLRDVA